ncbi:MAG: ankyrin repeat domain-containing protein [Simkaniaceae bacterium]|nr:ankyrin repeat domain-containing protein [Simkaniaceae bacterium]
MSIVRAGSESFDGAETSREAGTSKRVAYARVLTLSERVCVAVEGGSDRRREVAEHMVSVRAMNRQVNRDIDGVRTACDGGADPSLVDGDGSLLVGAVSSQNETFVRFLIERRVHVNAYEEGRLTPLTAASIVGNAHIASALLFAGAEANLFDGKGQLPLVEASAYGHVGVALCLFLHGADMNLADEKKRLPLVMPAPGEGVDMMTDGMGRTPLEAAVQRGHVEMVRLLLERGADPLKYAGKVQPLAIAASYGYTDIASYLLKGGADVHRRDENGRTPLMQAVRMRANGKMVRSLLEYGADPELVDANGWSSLVIATLSGNMAVALLLEFGVLAGFGADGRRCADEEWWIKLFEERVREKVSETVRTLLMQAVRQRNEKGMHRLLDKCGSVALPLDLNEVSETGQTLLTEAVRQGEEGIVCLLLRYGADVTRTDGEGWLPLTMASASGKSTVASLLLDSGADPNHADGKGRTPFREALRHGHKETVYLLFAYGVPTHESYVYGPDEKEPVCLDQLVHPFLSVYLLSVLSCKSTGAIRSRQEAPDK